MVIPNESGRYTEMKYNRCGRSGLLLPSVSLGFWHNFGSVDKYDNMVEMAKTAFELGITHFDLANNYGPRAGSAEENLGKMLKNEFKGCRDELVISTKAGHFMWHGPYGEWGSRKYLVSSLDASLKRMGLEYVDIFYSHRFDPDTPLEETMGALAHVVKQGKALYAGISNYTAEQTKKASDILKTLGVPCLIHQPSYSMFNRWIENGLTDTLKEEGIGAIAFSPLAQGLLTDKYLNGIPTGSRADKTVGFLKKEHITPEKVAKAAKLNQIASKRNQTLAQMALAWVMRNSNITSVLIGASSPAQIKENAAAMNNTVFTEKELCDIDAILAD
ncbi:MAG: aldo/keto reductase [Firmicutes bacterium]|nr:aldo/keto reductase [Bacillota bacterium]